MKRELDRLREKYRFPGATCAYVLSDGTLGETASGFADKETKEPMTTRSRMLAASIGKTFVAATVVALSNEYDLNLDDLLSCRLGKYHWYRRLPNHETITIRHLLTHSSGIKHHVHMQKFLHMLSQSDHSPESLIECILDEPPLFPAGKGWAYTDTGYILLGLVIEAVTGKTYYEELGRRFLNPLQLNSTTPSDRPYLPGLAPGYTPLDNPYGLPEKTVDATGSLVWNPAIEWTGGGLISTSRDLAVWAKLLYEGHAMESEYLPKLLQSVPINDGERRYGAGVVITPRSPHGKKLGHFGVIPGYTSLMQYYADYGAAIAFQVNTDANAAEMINDMELSLAESILPSRIFYCQ